MSRYIYLKNGDDLVCQELFDSEPRKKRIVEKWKSRYGKKFNSLVIEEEAVVKKDKYVPHKSNCPSYGRVHFNNKKGKISSVNFSGYKE